MTPEEVILRAELARKWRKKVTAAKREAYEDAIELLEANKNAEPLELAEVLRSRLQETQ